MIGHLRGKLIVRTPERLVIECGGVGYEVWVSTSTFYEVERAAGGQDGEGEGAAEIALHVHTHVREDALALFGFWSEREKLLFERLIAVSGIGPKLARVILSGMPPEDLLAALAARDAKRLATIPGVGKKTAERMVLELADKVADLAGELVDYAATQEGDDVVSALVNLGYKAKAAEKAVGQARQENPEGEFAELLRESLKRLSRA
ncbi:MAG TPA: Holliday junction branch migration protein RuvA [Thermoanaerobaculia bacterium]|nr:Holliday junction branch migration protein RuvA [Thermoanaerobaculia bacterium]